MKKILITGGTGFIGSHLVEFLIKKNYAVTAFDRYNINNNWGWLENSKYKKHLNVILGDIRDFDSVNNAVKGFDTILHLAALVGIPYSYISPLAYIKTNVEGTYNILEACKNNNVNQLIITSTSEVYGSPEVVPINEKHPIIGQSPYAATKIAADQLAISYYRSFGQNIKIIRPFNTFGPRQSARAVIPTIISQILGKNNYIKLGNIFPTRDYTYVEDLCEAYLEILKTNSLSGQVINVGSNCEISILELVKKLQQKLGKKKKITQVFLRKRKINSEVRRLICDNKKIIKKTNWKPKFSLDKGLDITIDWIKSNQEYFKYTQYNI